MTPPEPQSYRAPVRAASAEMREKGSRFVAIVEPCETEAAARARVAELERGQRGVTHVCWAWRLGRERRERCSDAGEPRGTAGEPMLRALRGADLSDVLAVVARWFGGTKLGKGGLARAYSQTVQAALCELETEDRRPTVELDIVIPYERIGGFKRLLSPPLVELVREEYGELVKVRVRVAESARAAFEGELANHGLETHRVEL